MVKKADFNTKVTEIEGKIRDISNLVKKTDFDTRLKKISDRVIKNKAKHFLVENELKNSKHLIQVIFGVKIILKEKMEHKIH